MNTNEYIASGILESYALGLCNATEAAGVERMCEQYPEIKAELDAVQRTLNGYAMAHTSSPDKALKDKIFEEIAILESAGGAKAKVLQLESTPKAVTSSGYFRYLMVASVVLLALSIIGNLVFYSRWKQANEQVLALSAEKNVLADNLKANQVKMEGMHKTMDVMSSPSVTRVMMKGVGPNTESMAMVYWDRQNKEVYVEVKSLPKLEEGKQFQLWAIVNGQPVDAGMLPMESADSINMMRMKDFETAQAFAITIEKMGGSPTPTMDKMVVMGATSG